MILEKIVQRANSLGILFCHIEFDFAKLLQGIRAKLDIPNIEHKELTGESSITQEHVKHNTAVRKVMLDTGIKPEELPPAEDIKRVGRPVKRDEKKIFNRKNVK